MIGPILPLLIGFGIDCVLGDPHSLPHPVVLIGKTISALECVLRRIFAKTPRGERAAGAVLWLIVAFFATAVPALLLCLCGRVSPWLRLAVESVMCWQILAAKSLRDESMKVYHELEHGSIESARRAVSMIVGRDTAELDDLAVLLADVGRPEAALRPEENLFVFQVIDVNAPFVRERVVFVEADPELIGDVGNAADVRLVDFIFGDDIVKPPLQKPKRQLLAGKLLGDDVSFWKENAQTVDQILAQVKNIRGDGQRPHLPRLFLNLAHHKILALEVVLGELRGLQTDLVEDDFVFGAVEELNAQLLFQYLHG